MIRDFLDWEEQHALELILKHHGVDDPALVTHLAQFINWIKADDEAKRRFGGPKPPYLLVLLGQMGIYTPKEKEPTA